MQHVHPAAGVMLAGGLFLALAAVDVDPLSFAAVLIAVVVLPALVSARCARWSSCQDSLERTAYAYGGVGLACWSLWIAGVVVGLNRWSILIAPVLAAFLLAAADSGTRAPRGVQTADPLPPASRGVRVTVWLTALTMATFVVLPFLPYGWQAPDGVHRMGMHDWYKHFMVTTALGDSAFPPANPFLPADGHAPYYYGFHLVAAAVQRLSGDFADTHVMLLGLTVMTAAAFPVVLFALGRGLLGDARQAAVAAVGGTTLLAGFDLVVWVAHAVRDVLAAWPLDVGVAALRAAVPSSHLDFWIHHNERQFNAPYVTAIWAPQHLAGAVLALLVIHLLRPTIGRLPVSRRLLPSVLLAVLPAISAYVALALVVGVTATRSARKLCAGAALPGALPPFLAGRPSVLQPLCSRPRCCGC